MEEYKKEFINFLIKTGALHIGGEFSLKSKRVSPWFVNVGDFNDGESIAILGEFYAEAILNSGEKFDLLYGIPEKGNALAISTSIGMNKKGKNVSWFFTRKVEKNYGEATNLSKEEKIKSIIVGKVPKEGDKIIQIDDVFTLGGAKYQAREKLDELGNFKFPLLTIAVDRQEVTIDGKNAIDEFEEKTGTKIISIVNAVDIYNFLREDPNSYDKKEVERLANYIRVYGTDSVREIFGKLEQKIIESDKSIIIACDVSFEEFEELIKETADIKGVGGYKIPATSGRKGWEKWIKTAKKYTDKPLIYDHQKAGTDIPDTAKFFMSELKEAGFDSVILFPQAGPETERAWIYEALNNKLRVIVGGEMTHQGYRVSEGGFITDEGILKMYRIAAKAGINNFVVPGNKSGVVKKIKETIENEGISPTFYSPGFIAQGGKISETAKVAGDKFHGIIGRGIYQSQDKITAVKEYVSQLN